MCSRNVLEEIRDVLFIVVFGGVDYFLYYFLDPNSQKMAFFLAYVIASFFLIAFLKYRKKDFLNSSNSCYNEEELEGFELLRNAIMFAIGWFLVSSYILMGILLAHNFYSVVNYAITIFNRNGDMQALFYTYMCISVLCLVGMYMIDKKLKQKEVEDNEHK